MNRLKSLRESHGWSRAELARRAGLNQVTVCAIESGRLVAYPSQLRKLEGALGVRLNPSDLIDVPEQNRPTSTVATR